MFTCSPFYLGLIWNVINVLHIHIRYHMISYMSFGSLFTCADFLVVMVLLRMTRNAALEAVLPKLSKPRVPCVGVQTQLQKVLVKWLNFFRLQLHCDPTICFLLISFYHLITICPAITLGEKREGICVIMIQLFKHSFHISYKWDSVNQCAPKHFTVELWVVVYSWSTLILKGKLNILGFCKHMELLNK